MSKIDRSFENSPQQPRLVIEPEDAEFLKKVMRVTRCGSASKALSIFISRCGDFFLESWEMRTPPSPTGRSAGKASERARLIEEIAKLIP